MGLYVLYVLLSPILEEEKNEQKIFPEKQRRRVGQHQRRDDVSIVPDARVGSNEWKGAQKDFDRRLSTRRDGRVERGRPIRRAGILQSAFSDRGSAPRRQEGRSRTRRPAIDLDGFFALHPALAPFKPIYDSGQLAIIHAAGSPDNTRSHFDAQDYMESATPGVKSTTDGWLNRYLQSNGAAESSPFRGVAMGPTLPRVMQGKASAIAMNNINDFTIRAAAARRDRPCRAGSRRCTRKPSTTRCAAQAKRPSRP